MVRFTSLILKFDKKGEKTGWTHIEIPAHYAEKLMPGTKKSFRVKGSLDAYPIKQTALLPMGKGNFIMPLNAAIRKAIEKTHGDTINVLIEADHSPLLPSAELMLCLSDEPEALHFFHSLTKSHQNYFTKWIESAKTESTKAKRIAQAVNALLHKQNFVSMIRSLKNTGL